jgi:tetratricopeptide (TPR) repeat protein
MPGSIFRIESIQDDGTLAIIRTTLCGDNDNDLKPLYEYMRKDSADSLVTLGHVLCDFGKFDQAEEFYEKMLQELPPTEPNFGTCCRGLGSIFEIRGDYDRSLKWYQTALNFWQNLLSPNHEAIGHAHISIGGIYKRTKQFEKARESFNNALHVWRKAYGEESQTELR